MVGSPKEAKNYSYTLKFHGIQPNVSNVYNGIVVSIDEFSMDTLQSGNCFGMDFNVFQKQFLDKNRDFKISVSIKKVTDAK